MNGARILVSLLVLGFVIASPVYSSDSLLVVLADT